MAVRSFLVLLALVAVAYSSSCIDWEWTMKKMTATNYQEVKEAQFECRNEAKKVCKERNDACDVMPSQDAFKDVVGLRKGATVHRDFSNCGLFRGYTELSKKYVVSVDRANWFHARLCCQIIGAELAMPKTLEERKTLVKAIKDKKISIYNNHWLGGNDFARESVWVFNDGTPINRSLFSRGEPNDYIGKEDCLVLYREHLGDYSCGYTYNFICQLK